MARVFPSEALASIVRHYWTPRWNIPDGGHVQQTVLDYPAMNLVIEADDARLYRALRGRSTRTLTGSGWAFGVLLQPGAGRRLLDASARSMPAAGVPVERLAAPGGSEVAAAVRGASDSEASEANVSDTNVSDTDASEPGASGASDTDHAMIAAFEAWLIRLDLPPDPDAERVRAIVTAVETDRSLLRVDTLAAQFGMGVRRLQRLVTEYVGFGPKWLIQRYRLQEAAHALEDMTPPRIADLAAALGYADQAHFGREFKTVVGKTPGEYLADASRARARTEPA
jgi:AraC-like DNA-binding protein